MLIVGTLCLSGCGGQSLSPTPAQIVCEDSVTTAQVIQAAEHVLTHMQFSIEKLDVGQGIIRTRPLRGAQFFEFWRSDNAGPYSGKEANLQSIRRSVELRVRSKAEDRRPAAGDTSSLQRAASGLCIECDVSVQRLSLPGHEVVGTSQAYRIHSRSSPTLQRLELTRQQEQAMAWIDLGKDPDLATRILERVERRFRRLN